jgi:predicted exporter
MKKLLVPVVGIWLLFLLVCGAIVAQATFTADMSAFLPRNPSARQQILIDQISEGFASRTLIVAISGVSPRTLAKISRHMGDHLRGESTLATVNNGQAQTSEKDQAFLFANRYVLSPAVTPARMQAAGLRSAIASTIDEVASSTGLFSKSLLASDPTGEMLEILKRVIPANQPLQFDGVWMNPKQTRALLLLQTKAQGSDLDAQEAVHALINTTFETARAATGADAGPATLAFSGPGVFAVQARGTIKSEAARLSVIGTLAVLTLLWLIYRSFTTLFLGVIPVVTGAIAGVAAVALGFSSVHGMTLGFGITLIGEAVDYAIYLFVQYAPSSNADDAATAAHPDVSIGPFWPTIRLGVLTSIVGFSTLVFSGFTGLAQLGLFSIVGIVVAALVTRYVLPALLPAGFAVRPPRKLGPILVQAVTTLSKLKVVALVLAATAVTVLVINRDTLWSVELGGLSPVSESAQNLDAELRAEIGAPDAGLLVALQADSSEAALRLSEEVSARLNPLVESGELGGFQAPSLFLPSQHLQQIRLASLPDARTLRAETEAALPGLGLQAGKLEAFFLDVERTRTAGLLTRTSLEGTSLSLGVDSLLMQSVRHPDRWTALIMLQPRIENGLPRVLDVKTIKAALDEWTNPKNASVHVIELGAEASNIYKAYLKEAIVLSAAGLVAIIGLLYAVLRSGRRVLRVVLPLLSSAAIVAAAVVLIKGNLSLLHLIGLLLVVAIGSNYALFFDQRASGATLQDNLATNHNMLCSLFFANLTTVLGFGLLAFSSVPVMNAIGSTVGSGTLLALMLSAVFAKRPSAVPA